MSDNRLRAGPDTSTFCFVCMHRGPWLMASTELDMTLKPLVERAVTKLPRQQDLEDVSFDTNPRLDEDLPSEVR